MMGGMVFSRLWASVGRACGMTCPDGPVGGLNGLEVTEGEPEEDEVDCALGPVGMPLLGPTGASVGEAAWLLPEME